VLEPEVKGKAATGFLWFFSVPGGDAFLEFCDGRGQDHPRQRLLPFKGPIQTDAYEVYKSLQRQRPRQLKRLGCLAPAPQIKPALGGLEVVCVRGPERRRVF